MSDDETHDDDGGSQGHDTFEDDEMLVKVLIAPSAAGCIIGKGGSVINEFQTTTGARIQISRNGETFPGSADRVISVRGAVGKVLEALHHMIAKLVEDNEEMGAGGVPSVRLVVPNTSCGGIIGKGGSQIRAAMEDSGSQISLSAIDKMLPGVTDRVLQITGQSENILRALALVVVQLLDDPSHLPHALRPSAFLASSPVSARGEGNSKKNKQTTHAARSAKDVDVVVTVSVPDEHIGAVLGKGGRTISEIQVASGVRIKVSDRNDFEPGTRNRKVTLFGTEQGTKLAHALLKQKLSNPGNPAGGPSRAHVDADW